MATPSSGAYSLTYSLTYSLAHLLTYLLSRSSPLELKNNGDAILGSSVGRWGTMNDPTIGTSCPVNQCLFVDMRGGAEKFNAHVEVGRLTLFSNHYTTHPSEAAKAQWSCAQV